MGSASMLFTSSGMLPDDLRAYCKCYELCARIMSCAAGGLHVSQGEQNARAPQSCRATYTVPAPG